MWKYSCYQIIANLYFINISYIENVFMSGYIRSDLVKAKLAKISTAQNIPLSQNAITTITFYL